MKPCSWCGAPGIESLARVNGMDVAACRDHLIDLGAVLAGEIQAPTAPEGTSHERRKLELRPHGRPRSR
jgi:hypothetical protein